MADVPSDTLAQFSTLLNGALPPGRHWELLWRSSRDGATPVDFHRLCDWKGPTITLVRDVEGCVFGGYASVEWGPRGSRLDASAFVFSVLSSTIVRPTQYSAVTNGYSVLSHPACGPTFSPLWIYDNLYGTSCESHCAGFVNERWNITPVDVETFALV